VAELVEAQSLEKNHKLHKLPRSGKT